MVIIVSETEFRTQSEAAMKYMREMNAKANPKKENHHTENIQNHRQFPKKEQRTLLPFANLLKNSDTTLILGLLLLLFNEKADQKLLFALIYILI